VKIPVSALLVIIDTLRGSLPFHDAQGAYFKYDVESRKRALELLYELVNTAEMSVEIQQQDK
jgi:hypothetical protein